MAQPETNVVTFQSLASRLLPSSSQLLLSSCCPTRDLIALVASTSSTDANVNLWRTTGTADAVWEWNTAGPGKGAAKGKGKALGGEILGLAWNPEGTYLAVGVSAAVTATPSTFTLLSAHTGLSTLPPISLPRNSSAISHLSWQPLSHPNDPNLSSYAASLIAELPPLPSLAKEAKAAATAAGGAAAASGVFGSAKLAALQRERDKEAGRALDLPTSAEEFPTLLPSGETEQETGSSILLVGDTNGSVHLYLGGSVFLGSVVLEPGHTVASISVLPSSSSTIRISVLLSSLSYLRSRSFNLTLPPSLDVFARHSTLLRVAIEHAFEALQEVRVLWDESRRIGRAWLARLAELSKSHGIDRPPISQLLMLLATGRTSASTHDFLASKMNERGLAKWETTTALAMEKLRGVTFLSIAPAMEQVVLLLDECKAWSQWPDKFASFDLKKDYIESELEAAKQIIVGSVELERQALEEERCFSAFANWIRYEFEKVAHAEGSEIRPVARFQPIPVAHYIRHCLPWSRIMPYLEFGPSQRPIMELREVRQGMNWFRCMELPTMGDRKKESQVLERLLSKMELTLSGRGGEMGKDKEDDARMRGHPDSFAKPNSIPVLLHLLAASMGIQMANAMQRIGAGAVVDEKSIDFGDCNTDASSGPSARERVVQGDGPLGAQYSVWLGSLHSTLNIVRRGLEPASLEGATFVLKIDDPNDSVVPRPRLVLEIIEFDFFDDTDLLLTIKMTRGHERPVYTLSAISLESCPWSPWKSLDDWPAPTQVILSRSHILDPQFPPQYLALNGRTGRRVACVLGGKGRKLEVFDIDAEEEGEGEGMEED